MVIDISSVATNLPRRAIISKRSKDKINSMKELRIISVLLTIFQCLPLTLSSQNPQKIVIPKDVPIGVTKISITTGLGKSDNYNMIINTLLDNDYQIDRADDKFYTVSTMPKPHPRLNMSCKFNFVARDSTILLSGMYMINASIDIGAASIEPSYSIIQNKGQTGSPMKEAFREMLKLAMHISDITNFKYVTSNYLKSGE
jgi:hypothetical protein